MIIGTAVCGFLGFCGNVIASILAAFGKIPLIGLVFKGLATIFKLCSGVFKILAIIFIILMLLKLVLAIFKNRKAKKAFKQQQEMLVTSAAQQAAQQADAQTQATQVTPVQNRVHDMDAF